MDKDKEAKSELDLYTRSEISFSTACVSGHRLPILGDIKRCTEDCPIFDRCKAQKVDELCIVQKNYLGTVVKDAVNKLTKPVDTALLDRIGLIMIPLYNDLFLFQLVKSALPKVTIGSGVNLKIHPVFRVIRETIATIDKQWEKVGLSKTIIGKLKDSNEKDLIHGDGEYYESISK